MDWSIIKHDVTPDKGIKKSLMWIKIDKSLKRHYNVTIYRGNKKFSYA